MAGNATAMERLKEEGEKMATTVKEFKEALENWDDDSKLTFLMLDVTGDEVRGIYTISEATAVTDSTEGALFVLEGEEYEAEETAKEGIKRAYRKKKENGDKQC